MMKKYPAPHIRGKMNGTLIPLYSLIALLPCEIAAVYYYGVRAIIILLLSMTMFALSDYLYARYIRRDEADWDTSSLVNGAILALILPPTVSIWILLAGVLFGSVIVRQWFGGLGCSLFHPALAARAFLSIAFPALVSTYAEPITSRWTAISLWNGPVDTISSATPSSGSGTALFELFSGRYSGALGETCAIAIVMGGVFLITSGILRLHAPTAYLLVITIGYILSAGSGSSVQGGLKALITGGVLFGAVFVMGDTATTPTSQTGRVIFGAGAGCLTLLIQHFGNEAYAVGFAILAMNAVTPILDLYIRPRVFSKPDWYARNVKKVTALREKKERRV